MNKTAQVQAKVRQISQWSPIWIVPVVAVLIGAWMLFHTYKNQGPSLTLLSSNAEGIVAGKTQIKSRSVDVGKVISVELSQDLKQVVIRARMNPGTENLLNDESQLWVVKPTVGRGGVSGLNTLLSGAYIELQPGKGESNKFFFELRETPPIAPPDAAGVRVYLTSADASALAVGDPVLYRGFDVGTVEQSEFDTTLRSMRYQLFIRAPYDALVTENVRFWKASGMALDMSAEGVRIEMSSITTLLSGGVTFDVLDGWPMGARAQNNTKFQLFESKKSIQDGLYNEYLEYVMFFEESVRGLTVGAPVEYHGVRIGTVAAVPFFFNSKNPLQLAFKHGIPVLVRIETGRMYGNLSLPQLQQQLDLAVEQGLTAVLKTGNLLTGGLYIELDHFEKATVSQGTESLEKPLEGAAITSPEQNAALQATTTTNTELTASHVVATPMVEQSIPEFSGYKVLPTTRSGLGHIEQKVMQALDKINNLPVEKVLADSSATLQETQKLMQQSQQLLQSLEQLSKQEATQALPAELQQSLVQLRTTLAGLSPGSPAYERMNSNLQAMDKVLRDLQPVIHTLNQQSNALILGSDPQPDPEPAKGTEQ